MTKDIWHVNVMQVAVLDVLNRRLDKKPGHLIVKDTPFIRRSGLTVVYAVKYFLSSDRPTIDAASAKVGRIRKSASVAM